jgi:hypothetical protein
MGRPFDREVPLRKVHAVDAETGSKGLAFLYDWLRSDDVRSMDISLCDEQGTPAVTWHVGRAVRLSPGSALQASGNEAAIESLELLVGRVTIEHH